MKFYILEQNLDLSRPPPGFGPIPVAPNKAQESIPLNEIEVPYYSLPAGLMLKQIKVIINQRFQ